MNIVIQIESCFLSILFGIIFSFFYNLFYYLLYTKYWLLNVVSNMFFILVMFSLYYLFLYLVNNGNIHIYFIIIMFISFFVYNKIFVKLRVKWLKNRLN